MKNIQSEVKEAFRYSESISDYKILHIGISEDHVHLLTEFKPSLSIGQVVRRMKSITTNELWKTQSEHLKKFYWKGRRLLWTSGYFAETTGDVSFANIAEYIKNQGS